MVQYGEQIESPITALGVWQARGAVSRVGEDETAFNGRSAGHTFNIGGNTTSVAGFEEERGWVHRFWTALQPHQMCVYVNFLMDEGHEPIRQAYGTGKVPAPAGAQAEVRPHELLSSEPEHPARLGCGPAGAALKVVVSRRSAAARRTLQQVLHSCRVGAWWNSARSALSSRCPE